MSDYGIKVSDDGDSVFEATSEQLLLSSATPNPMIQVDADPPHFDFKEVTIDSEPPQGATELFSVPHGYTYTPASYTIASFWDPDVGSRYGQYHPTPHIIYVFDDLQLNAYCDFTHYYLELYRGIGPESQSARYAGNKVRFKYYIYAQDGT